MKTILLFLAGCPAILAQPLSVGVKGGLPLTDFVDAVSSGGASLTSDTKPYLIGPTVELRLPAGFGIEFDALYRRFGYNVSSPLTVITGVRTTGNDWEFPLLLKKRLSGGLIRPFVDAGVNFSKITGLTQTVVNAVRNVTSTDNPPELKHDFSTGFVLGAGLDIHVLLHITPEIRYTRWGSEHFQGVPGPGGTVSSNQNQAEFLLGITF